MQNVTSLTCFSFLLNVFSFIEHLDTYPAEPALLKEQWRAMRNGEGAFQVVHLKPDDEAAWITTCVTMCNLILKSIDISPPQVESPRSSAVPSPCIPCTEDGGGGGGPAAWHTEYKGVQSHTQV